MIFRWVSWCCCKEQQTLPAQALPSFLLFCVSLAQLLGNMMRPGVRISCDDNIMIQIPYQFQNIVKISLWQLLSIKENICPDRHRKSHALQDAKKYFFLYITRKMRSTAFQPCITLGGLHWDEMGQKHDFLKKNALKTAFLGDTILDRLTSEGVGSPKKIKNATFLMLSFNDGP